VSRAGEIRETAKSFGKFFLHEMFDELKAETKKEKQKIRSAISDLVKEGSLERFARGFYEYKKDGRNGRPKILAQKMWKAMSILRRFTKEDIAMISDASPDYTSKYFMIMTKKGHIKKIGMKKKGKRVAVYQIIEKPNTRGTA